MLKLYLAALLLCIVLLISGFRRKNTWQGKSLLWVSYFSFLLLLTEIACQAGYYISTGRWLFREAKNPNGELFEPHPYLVVTPRKNISRKINGNVYSHNSEGWRGRERSGNGGSKKVLAIGGSTTYGVGVDDHETWPVYLDSLLGNGYEVINLGVPGHSAAEHLIVSALIAPDFSPRQILIHAGINDIHTAGVEALHYDYSGFHPSLLHSSMGQCYQDKLPRIASVRLFILLLEKASWLPRCPGKNISPEYADNGPKALALYRRNLRSVAALLKSMEVGVVFIPHVRNTGLTDMNRLSWWIPGLSAEQYLALLHEANRVMIEVGREENVPVISKLDSLSWEGDMFADAAHLNARGNLEFAAIVGHYIASGVQGGPADTILAH